MNPRLIAGLRLIAGFLLAPIVPGMIVLAVAILLEQRPVSTGLWFLGLTAVLGYPVALLLGVPIYFVLRWRNYHDLIVYVCAGGVLGGVDFLIYLIGALSTSEWSAQFSIHLTATAYRFLPLGIINGCIAGASFWMIARPDLCHERH